MHRIKRNSKLVLPSVFGWKTFSGVLICLLNVNFLTEVEGSDLNTYKLQSKLKHFVLANELARIRLLNVYSIEDNSQLIIILQ